MFKFDDIQAYGKNGYEASMASTAAMTKGYQSIAQEVADFSRKSFEKNTAVVEQAIAVKSFDKVLEVQQAFAKESYDTLVAEAAKISEIYVAAAKEAYKPFETSFNNFGFKFGN
jgi:hypothetical protein